MNAASDEIRRTISLLLERGTIVELRVIGASRGIVLSGYYDHHAALVRDAARWSARGGVYVTLNPVLPALLARAPNRLVERPKQTTGDHEVIRRARLLVDLDPVRPAGISSTNEEHEAALGRAREIQTQLGADGWPAPLLGDSGNGAHLVHAVDLPNDDAATALVKRVLAALAARFDDERVTVDRATFNAARITKVFGTIAAKGVSTADRPHRLARIVEAPERLIIVPRELLEQLAAMAPPEPRPRAGGGRSVGDVEAALKVHGFEITKHKPWGGGDLLELRTCPWDPAHLQTARVIVFDNGAIAAGCFHAACAGRGWRELREVLGDDFDGAQARQRARRRAQRGDGKNEAPGASPFIDAGDLDLPRVSAQAWEALKAANDPPVLFRAGTVAVRLEAADGAAPMLRPLDQDRLCFRLARVARWGRETRDGGWQPALPPAHVVRDLLADPDPPLPPLERVVGAPVFAADGRLLSASGYHLAARLYHAPASGLTIPDAAEAPPPDEVKRARDLLVDELLGDFPFTGDPERAHAVALLLLPFVREMIPGSTPLHLVEKPAPGTGAGLLVRVLMLPALGGPPPLMTEGRHEDEWRKRLTAKLVGGPAVVVIDNAHRLESANLSAAITAPIWEDRVLGRSEMVRVRPRCAWVATGNNPALSSEIARRTIRIRLDAKMDRPWLRREFRHPDLSGWALAHRGELVGAALTLVRTWIAAGSPAGTAVLGEFEGWARVLGGILEKARIPGFLGNLDELYEMADAESAEVRRFLVAWWQRHHDQEVGVSDLFELATSADVGMDLAGKNERGQRTALGQRLPALRDRHYSVADAGGTEFTLRVVPVGTRQGAGLWRLQRGEAQSGGGEGSQGSQGSPTDEKSGTYERGPAGEPLDPPW